MVKRADTPSVLLRALLALLAVMVIAVAVGRVTFSAFTATITNSNSVAAAPVFPPENSVLPSITGILGQGQTLSVNVGTWNRATAFTYQWQSCASGSCSDIGGATASTYVPGVSDLGATLRVNVTGSNAGPTTTSALSAITAAIASGAPTNSVLPALSGLAAVGSILSATQGTWSVDNPSSATVFSYQWQRCSSGTCSDIATATGTSYTLVNLDLGATVQVKVTGTNAYGANTATSAPSSVVQSPVPTIQTAPAISGVAQQGLTLTGSNGTWANSPTSYTYQWLQCNAAGSPASCVNISGATSITYVPVLADVGTTLELQVTASNASGPSLPASSAVTGVIASGAPVNTLLPLITGTATQGQVLSATSGTWLNGPTSYTYQWQDCDTLGANCVSASGPGNTTTTSSTTNTYTLVAGDVGHTIRVQVTATNAFGSTNASSLQTLAVS